MLSGVVTDDPTQWERLMGGRKGDFGLSPRGLLPRGLWVKLGEPVNWDEEIHFLKTNFQLKCSIYFHYESRQ